MYQILIVMEKSKIELDEFEMLLKWYRVNSNQFVERVQNGTVLMIVVGMYQGFELTKNQSHVGGISKKLCITKRNEHTVQRQHKTHTRKHRNEIAYDSQQKIQFSKKQLETGQKKFRKFSRAESFAAPIFVLRFQISNVFA